jgi:alpha-beta hydrolase superfamily lysophospholipase
VQSSNFTMAAPDAAAIFVHRWLPDSEPKAVVQIAHGLAEHAARYARLAGALTTVGYAVYANDHRGHGRSAQSPEDLGFFAERDGWRKCLGDLWQLNRRITADHPGVPIVLLGHSMGSFMAQHFISDHGETLAGAVLSGSGGKPNALGVAGRFIARLERLRLGPRGRSALLTAFSFGAFNKPFAPARTPADWLSRDPAEVDKYVADPLCGFAATTQLWIDMLDALGEITSAQRQARIPKRLPIYVIAGTRDAVSNNTKSLEQLLTAYRAAGLERVTHRFYPEARHELFNEINRDEITRDLISWLEAVVMK